MEEDSCVAFLLDSSVYVNDHVGFSGNIKTFPSDFVVTEINAVGQLVNEIAADSCHASCETLSEETQICQHNCKRLKLNPPDLCAEEECYRILDDSVYNTPECLLSSNGESEEYNAKDLHENHLDKALTLDSLLEESVREKLSQFACRIKEVWHSKQQPEPLLAEFSLGLVLDKKIRASLHSAIRQKYPFLVSVTKCDEMVLKANQDYHELCKLVSEEEACGFLRFLDAKLESSKFAFRPDGDKEHRKMVHHFLSKRFGKLVEAKTFPDSEQKVVIIVRFREKSGFRKRLNAKSSKKEEIYTAFTLRKENVETLEAISYLSCELGMLPSDFSYTGIKDKKAVTYQTMVVKKVTPSRLKELGDTLGKKGLRVSSIQCASQPLRLGELKGNHFDIIVRKLKLHSSDGSACLKQRICEAIENIKKNGFINYYGPQRFGLGQNIQTDQIGLALLNEELVKAVKLFFTPEDSDDPVNKAKKYFLETEDAKGTIAMLPDFKVREKMLLRALNRYGINHEGCTRAWLSIPHSMRIFYVHAYCSKIWNEAVSYRMKIYGTRVVAGDLIFSTECTENSLLNNKIHVVTSEEEMANKYVINQVVLPMVGYSVHYPTHKVGEWYRERLARDKLQMCQFRLPMLQLNVPGCYRPILKYPHDMLYRFINSSGQEGGTGESLLPDAETSLLLSFWLDPSCYATVCLREIMKCEL